MKGVKHVRRWKEEALRGELSEPGVVALLRHDPTHPRRGARETDLVAPRTHRDHHHAHSRLALGRRAQETLGRTVAATRVGGRI